jgi:hypothetical protein
MSTQFLDPLHYEFDFELMVGLEIGAWLVAILAFPGDWETNSRRMAAEAMIAGAVNDAYPEVRSQWHAIFPFSGLQEFGQTCSGSPP